MTAEEDVWYYILEIGGGTRRKLEWLQATSDGGWHCCEWA